MALHFQQQKYFYFLQFLRLVSTLVAIAGIYMMNIASDDVAVDRFSAENHKLLWVDLSRLHMPELIRNEIWKLYWRKMGNLWFITGIFFEGGEFC